MTEKIPASPTLPSGSPKAEDKLRLGGGGGDTSPTGRHAGYAETDGADTLTHVEEEGDGQGEKGVIDGLDPVYAAKARVLNRALQDLGMGRYQWQLFFVIGFGWAQDNLWPIVTSLILPAVAAEFRVAQPPLLTLAQNIGLLAGAFFWGFGCDIFGRRWGFNLTLGTSCTSVSRRLPMGNGASWC